MGELVARWKRVRFGDVVENSTAATKDYKADGFTRYIIGKHIPQDGRVTDWNPVDDGEFGSRIRTIVRAGDVICTTRGPKLRVAVASFDCLSAHTNFILRAMDERVILQEIAEAVARSSGFQDHLRRNFRGSTNLFVNWSDAAKYEFALPPLEEQRRLVRRLSAVQRALEATVEIREQIRDFRYSMCEAWALAGVDELLPDGSVPEEALPTGWQCLTLDELCRHEEGAIGIGPFGSDLVAADYSHPAGVPVVFVADVVRHRFTYTSNRYVTSQKATQLAAHQTKGGDVLVTKMGWPPGEACVVSSGFGPAVITADLIRIRPNPRRVRAEYLAALINSHWGSQQVVRISPGTTRPKTTLRDFRRLRFALPPMAIQEERTEAISGIQVQLAALDRRISQARVLLGAATSTSLVPV